MVSNRTMLRMLSGATAVALVALPPLGFAQDAETLEGSDQATQQAEPQANQSEAAGQPTDDTLVATVGDAEIRGSDIRTVIGLLPEPVRAQQPEMLVPIALDQLVLRELILQKAESENLAEDTEVQALVESSAKTAREDAMVQVWLAGELDDAVTDEAVQRIYDELSASSAEALPSVDQVRPQIEQHLRQQAMMDIRAQLQQGADVVFYDPAGQPIEEPAAGQQGAGTAGAAQPQATGDATQGSDAPQAADGNPATEGDAAQSASGETEQPTSANN
jgi:hypothetical protein